MRARWHWRLSAALLMLGAAPTGIGPARPPASESSVLVTVGETTAQSARLWLRAEVQDVRIDVGLADGGARRTLRAHPDPARDFTAVVELSGLQAGGRYTYEVEGGGRRLTGRFPRCSSSSRGRRSIPPGTTTRSATTSSGPTTL